MIRSSSPLTESVGIPVLRDVNSGDPVFFLDQKLHEGIEVGDLHICYEKYIHMIFEQGFQIGQMQCCSTTEVATQCEKYALAIS